MNGVAIHPIANQDPSRRGLHLAQPWSEDVSRFICRYEVPVDDQWHEFEIHSEPLAVACRNPRVVACVLIPDALPEGVEGAQIGMRSHA